MPPKNIGLGPDLKSCFSCDLSSRSNVCSVRGSSGFHKNSDGIANVRSIGAFVDLFSLRPFFLFAPFAGHPSSSTSLRIFLPFPLPLEKCSVL